MNNKSYKNFIAFSFAFFVLFSASSALAAVTSTEGYNPGYADYNNRLVGNYAPTYTQSYYPNQSYYGYNQQITPTYTQPQVTYTQPAQYIPAPTQAPTVQYVQSDIPTTYVNTDTSSNTTKSSTTKVASKSTAPSNIVSNSNQVVTPASATPNTNLSASAIDSADNLTALSMNGKNVFMPDTVFEWFLAVIFILIIIILVRVIGKKDGHGGHH